MRRVPLFKLLTRDQNEALAFYVEKLGFQVAEDNRMGDYRWLLVRLPDNRELCVNLELARNDAQRAVVGKQAADLPLFSIETDDCLRDYAAMSARGVAFEAAPEVRPFGTGAMLKDLYGNKIYLNQDPSR
jgi:catechol 2,3-dioxygenase-like lactoylglutathione lyase family enzyme